MGERVSRQKWVWAAGTATALLALVFAFQNCSQPMLSDEEDQLASEAEKLDFAYDTVLDQITYMSCALAEPGTYEAGAYFSLRAGAYRSGGIRLNDAFRASQGRKPLERQANLLSISETNTSTSAQLAIRGLGNFQVMYTSNGTATKGKDFVDLFQPLGTVDLSDIMVSLNPASRLRYLRNGSVFGSRLEGSLYFTASPKLAGSIRDAFNNNDGFLAQTYSHTTGTGALETAARGPRHVIEGSTSNPATQVYGRGYKLRFSQPTLGGTGSSATFPKAVLSKVDELNTYNAADISGQSAWTCPESMRLRIVRAEDVKAGKILCAISADPPVLSAELALVRNQLRAEDWYVDLANRCIVAKKSVATCYGAVTNVEYDISKTCSEGQDPAACVSYASVCYRGN